MTTAIKLPELGDLLAAIVVADMQDNYDRRNPLVAMAVAVALHAGYAAGFRLDTDEPEWPVAYIELPTGQVSWHLPQHSKPWDGHDTDEKHARIAGFLETQRKPW